MKTHSGNTKVQATYNIIENTRQYFLLLQNGMNNFTCVEGNFSEIQITNDILRNTYYLFPL